VRANVKLAGYNKPTPIQKNTVPISMGGRDLMACAQTGSGKTASFLLPAITKLVKGERPPPGRKANPMALILSPTRELTMQIYNEARKPPTLARRPRRRDLLNIRAPNP
jgi:superfamily II DNA/RNA helicase